MRLGVQPIRSNQLRVCACGKELADISHLLSCNSLKGGEVIKRHDKVVHTLIKYIRKVGGTAVHEPMNLDDNSLKRVDIDACIGFQRFLIYVKIANPTASTNIMRAKTSLGTALAAEKQKTSHHNYLNVPSLGEKNSKSDTVFVPYIVESFGGTAPQAVTFNTILANIR